MKKIYYLSSCSTCQRIIKQLNNGVDFELQDIKSDPITEAQLTAMRDLTDSYESLFSRRAMKYKSMGLKDKSLSEEDYKRLILEEYTFLKRPVILIDGKIYVGNSKSTIAAVEEALSH